MFGISKFERSVFVELVTMTTNIFFCEINEEIDRKIMKCHMDTWRRGIRMPAVNRWSFKSILTK